METINTLDVRIIEPRLKHPSIFQRFDQLKKDEAFIIINDHDPLPLFYQFKAERPDQFEWEYLEEGPETWQVCITKTKETGKTVADILLENPKAAGVFKKFHIDYCCKGKTPFEEACAEAGLDPEVLQEQIDQAGENPAFNMRAQDWGLDFLADYIVHNHHQYVRDTTPDLLALSEKVTRVHGNFHPELHEVNATIYTIAEELMQHMVKEEQMLFPAIKKIFHKQSLVGLPFTTIQAPINMMEVEHANAGDGFDKIRELTDNFTVPQDACTSYRLLFDMMQAYEDDLHQHVHLENNILFPKAIALEKSTHS
jgi:regulator of cell morphogenesis and NO signaling